jgi:polyvinyl alcohol dehydrogenase (cytochrome)
VFAGVLLATACSSDTTDDAGGDAATTTTTAAPTPPSEPWTVFGFDATNSRYNASEATLTPDNVENLTEQWRLELGTGMSATPMVADGIAYIADWSGNVFAVDVSDGSEVWKTEVGGTFMASVTLDGDAVYAVSARELTKLDRATGEEIWQAQVTEHPIAIAPAAPVVAGDLVLQGTASGELMIPTENYTFRGSVAAFDSETGDEVWRFWVTEDDETSGAGVGIWSTPSIDEELGLGFVGTGNTYEPPASPLSDSIVAFDLETGEIVWSTQFTVGDVWSMGNTGGVDGDVGAGPNLWEADGRKLVGAGDKRGEFHALDRETGEVVWEIEMTAGSVLGGVIGTSAQADGVLYVASNHGNPDNNAPLSRTSVLAIDGANGEVLWETELEGATFAPVSVTPGLVYVGTTAAMLHILSADTGEELWSMEVPDQVGAGASVVDGVVYWGYGFALLGSGSGQGALMALSLGDGADSGDEGDDEESLGERVFRTSCSSCHGTRGQGAIGPSLVGVSRRLDEDEHRTIVLEGVRQMPAFEDALTAEEIDAVIEYERTQLGE